MKPESKMKDQGNILVVDDTHENLRLLINMLSENGYLVRPVRNGTRAIASAKYSPPDVILLDILMPDLDGYDVCDMLKADESTRDIPIIFISALQETFDKVRAFELGGVDYITKPFQKAEVLARIKTHLALKRAREAIIQQRQALKQQNCELLEAARLREDVERVARHDLKSPLNAILGYPDLIITQGNLTEQQVYYLTRMKEAGHRMLTMINHSLDLFKIEQGLYQIQPVTVNVRDVIQKVITELQPLTQTLCLTIDIVMRYSPHQTQQACFVRGEEMLCYSMLANVIKNALEASPEGESVQVELSAKQEETSIRIRNLGTVPIQIRERFFEKYVTWGKGRDGTGLGTYSAKRFAEVQGGTMSMTTSEQNGTIITIRLPTGCPGRKEDIPPENTRSECDEQASIIPPPQEALMTLHHLAKIGDIFGIEKSVKHLEKKDQTYSPFVSRILQLREHLQLLEIQEFIAGFLEESEKGM